MIHLADGPLEPIDASRPPSSDTPLDQWRPLLGDLSLSPTSPLSSQGSDLFLQHVYFDSRWGRNYDYPPSLPIPMIPSAARRSPPASPCTPLSPCSEQRSEYCLHHSSPFWRTPLQPPVPLNTYYYYVFALVLMLWSFCSGKKNIDENMEISLGGEVSPGGARRSSSPARHASTMTHLADDPPKAVDPSRPPPSSDTPLDQWPFLPDLSPSPTSPPYSPRSTGSDMFCACQPSDRRYAYGDSSSKNGEPVIEENDPSLYDKLVGDVVSAASQYCQDYTYISHEQWEKRKRKLAVLALKRYNKGKNSEIKYSLVEVLSGAFFSEYGKLYMHMNFYAKARKKGSKQKLVFAELRCSGKHPNGYALTSFHVLDGQQQFLGRCDDVRSTESTEDKDMDHCYACDDRFIHPIGSKYMAGHFVYKSCYFAD